jgi:hypothetical protein
VAGTGRIAGCRKLGVDLMLTVLPHVHEQVERLGRITVAG